MQIKWSELTQVAEVSLAFGVGIVVVFALGVLALDRAAEGSRSRAVAVGGASAAFAVCAAAVGYGLYLMIPQFH